MGANCKSQPWVSCNHCRGNMHLIDSSLLTYQLSSLDHLRLFDAGKIFARREMLCNFKKKTRAYPSLRDSTCLNPKCSSHSSSIPCPLFLRAAPGVLATPHLLSQMEREALKVRPLEEESCRPIWLSVDQKTTQTERDVEAETSRVLALSHS